MRLYRQLASSFLVLVAVACEPIEDSDGQGSGGSNANSQASGESSASSKNSKDSQDASQDSDSNSSDSSTDDDDDDDDDDENSNTPDSDSEDSPDDDNNTLDTATPSEDSEDSDSEDSDSEDSESEDTGDETGNPDDEIDWEKEVAHVFPQDRIVKLSINFPSGDLQSIVDDWNTKKVKTRLGAAFDFEGKEQLEKVGVRLKGYSSLLFISPGQNGKLKTTDKLPLKINFDSEGGPRFHYFDKVGLANLIFDPSAIRERLAVRMFRSMGVPAPAIAHAEVVLDDTPVGVYSLIESLDKRFLKRFFGTKNNADDGNLYKCVSHYSKGPDRTDQICLLEWRGDSKSDYYKTEDCHTGYEDCGLVLKTNEDDPALNDYSDLIHFLDVLHHTPPDEFEMEIQEVFDVDNFLRLMAVNAVMVNLDSYFGRINNYYLYHRPDTDKFMMLPWDMNMAYGLYSCNHFGGTDLTEFSISDPVCRSSNTSQSYPLVDKILEVSSFRMQYEAYVDEFVEKHFTQSNHEKLVSQFDQQISASLEKDPNFAFSMEEYKTALSDELSDPSGLFGSYNLMDFVIRRRQVLLR